MTKNKEVRKLIESILPQLEQAIHDHPQSAEHHNDLANAYKLLGDIPRALQHYHEALRLKSPYPEAHNNLGALLLQLGQMDEAILHLQKSLRMDPAAINTHYNLAYAYVQKERLLDAIPHFEAVLKTNPQHSSTIHNLGIAYSQLKRYQEAEPLLIQAVENDPHHIEALYHLGMVQNSLGKLVEAQKTYEKILELNNQHPYAHHNLATLFLHLQDKENALAHYQEAFKLDPNNLTAKHMIAALTETTLPQGAPPEYTQALFNQYAFNYDEHVKSTLHYQVPEKLRSALSLFIQDLTIPCKVLDLGCGTGLCAPYFRDLASHLIGVDLSENMLFRAKAMGGYDKLIHDEALHFLELTQDKFNLIIAADVIVYMGDLSILFSLIKKNLQQKGFFCFSTETLNNQDYALQTTGRYSHSANYIQALARQYQFTVLFHQATELRMQNNAPIMGDLWILTD